MKTSIRTLRSNFPSNVYGRVPKKGCFWRGAKAKTRQCILEAKVNAIENRDMTKIVKTPKGAQQIKQDNKGFYFQVRNEKGHIQGGKKYISDNLAKLLK